MARKHELQIPIRFSLFGQTIQVTWDKELVNEDDHRGQAIYRRNEIRLQPSTEGKPIPDEQIEATFLHELFHFMFYLLGDYKIGDTLLRDDEHLGRIAISGPASGSHISGI